MTSRVTVTAAQSANRRRSTAEATQLPPNSGNAAHCFRRPLSARGPRGIAKFPSGSSCRENPPIRPPMDQEQGNGATRSGAAGRGVAFALVLISLAAAGCRKVSPTPESVPTVEAAAGTCGRPPLQPCPLQQWMNFNVAPGLREGRLERLAAPLGFLATLAPPEFPTWKAMALAGAAAAASRDESGVRRSCGGCHDAYRDRYRAAMRARPIVTTTFGRGAG